MAKAKNQKIYSTPEHLEMLAEEQRLEAARLERGGELSNIDAVVGREMKGADVHGASLSWVLMWST